MDAVELLLPDSKPSGVFLCGKCRRLSDGNGASAPYPQERAEACCRPHRCRRCEKPTGRNWSALCKECSNIEEHEREAERFEDAKKLTLDEWGLSDACDNYLYHSLADKWFSDLDDFEEWLADDAERERPAYLWCTTEVQWKPDASGDIADRIHDRFHEDACDQISDVEYQRLDEMVNAWWAENKPTSYEPDFSRCVLLPDIVDTPVVVGGEP